MARKSITKTFQDRDQELTFVIEEMSATKLERWLLRAVIALAGSGKGIDISNFGESIKSFDYSTLFEALGKIDFEKAEPILNELLECCSRKIGNMTEKCTPETVDSYINDVSTLFKLKIESAKLNLPFLAGVGQS